MENCVSEISSALDKLAEVAGEDEMPVVEKMKGLLSRLSVDEDEADMDAVESYGKAPMNAGSRKVKPA